MNTIDLLRAFSYPFDDRRWLEKLLILLVISAVSLLLSPLVIGLLGWAALFGYQVAIVRGWRAGRQSPLPTWDNFGRLINDGVYPLAALLLYQVPNVIIALTVLLINQNAGAGVVTGTLLFALLCCLAPFLLAYNLLLLPLFALALARHAEQPGFARFVEIGVLVVMLRDHAGQALLYTVLALLAQIIFAILGSVTFGILPTALGVLVFGALTGMLALAIDGRRG
jgi:hypothetical protein